VSKITEDIHAAVCQAVALLNIAPEVARCAEGRQARDILRQALATYADAYMDEPVTPEEFKAIARKHRRAAQAGIAAQAATTPLTDDAIADVVSSFDGNEDWNLHDFARAVLAAQEARNV